MDEADVHGSTSDGGRRRCPMAPAAPAPAQIFGVTMNGVVSAKINYEERFTNWAWLPTLTHFAASSVFSKPGLHIAVFVIIILGNVVYFVTFEVTAKHHAAMDDAQIFGFFMTESVDFYHRLLTWLLSGYVVIIVQQY
ncbi:hypothetical protein ACHAWF_014366 [Thalassiosira exigua]